MQVLDAILISVDSKNMELPEVQETCEKYAEVLNDLLLKLSFMHDFDFYEALQVNNTN